GVERGVLSTDDEEDGRTVVATLVRGAERSSSAESARGARRGRGHAAAGATARTAAVPRASHLFEGSGSKAPVREERKAWLTDFLEPVQNCFGGDEEDDVDCLDEPASNGFDYGADDDAFVMEGVDEDVGRRDDSNDAKYRGPRGFAAEDSWRYYGDLVEAIQRKRSPGAGSSGPRAVTLFTTDVNLFADVRSSAHVEGLERFWKRVQSGHLAVSSLTISIVETSTATAASAKVPDRLRVVRCVNDVRRRVRELAEDHLRSSERMPVDVDVDFVEGCDVSFRTLLQEWVGESFAKTFAGPSSRGNGSGAHGRLNFDLPETLDGVTCSITLDLECAVLPDSLRSSATRDLADDVGRISALSPSSVEVVQTAPLSSVDSSLIYGVPMRARAGMEDDVAAYGEMKALTRNLWRHLGRNDVALVLRARSGASEEGPVEGRSSDRRPSGEQLFLLVCEEAVQKPTQALDRYSDPDAAEALNVQPDGRRRGEAPCQGVLYRYATKRQILRCGSEEKSRGSEEEEENELSNHYLDYIERSLDTIVKTGLNPLLMG
ncbi:hypothetical protein ACHAWF_012794, partial [Thalassiosira exigua]